MASMTRLQGNAPLPPVALAMLEAALAGDEAARMALEDWLADEGREVELTCWRWARATGRQPSSDTQAWERKRAPIHRFQGWSWWRRKTQGVVDAEDLPPVEEGAQGWIEFPTREEAWQWLLETWAPLARKAGHL